MPRLKKIPVFNEEELKTLPSYLVDFYNKIILQNREALEKVEKAAA
jgi:hypothetical protein